MGAHREEKPMHPSLLIVRSDLSDLPRLQSELARAQDPLRLVGASDPSSPPCACEGEWVGAVIDLDAPEEQGRQITAAVRAKCAGVPVFGSSVEPTPEVLGRAARMELAGLVPWPCTAADLRRLGQVSHPDPAPSGRCAGIDSARLVALHAQAREDGVLVFWRPVAPGENMTVGSVHLESGQVVHAAVDGHVGVDAAREILSWSDAQVCWLPGRTGASRTIVGHWTGLLHKAANEGQPASDALEQAISIAYPEVVEKLSRLSHTPQVVAAFLLRHGEILSGAALPDLDEGALRHAASSLSRVLADMVTAAPEPDAGTGAMLRGPSAIQADTAREIQAIAAGVRIVVDRIGPEEAGFQAAVAVYQAAPVSKSLRRLIRQIDRAFHKAIARARGGADPVTRVA